MNDKKNEALDIYRNDQEFSPADGENWNRDGENHPRKQLRRDKFFPLNGIWDFAFDNIRANNHPSQVLWDKTIRVPFAPESRLSGIADTSFHNRCWYQKKFTLQRAEKRRYILHFGAADFETKVWINNQYLGKHCGGHTSFSFEITNELAATGMQTLHVCADDDPHDLAKPRGKQDWQRNPHSIWYPRTTGIWQTVWIEEVAEIFIDQLQWTPLLDRWEIGCEVFLSQNQHENLTLRVKLSCDEKVLAYDTYQVFSGEVHRRIALSDPGIDDFRNELLWSPEKPTLIYAEIELWQGETLLDAVHSYTALRSICVQKDRFLLNGRPYFMRFVLDQGYWPESLMTAPTPGHLKRDVELVKSAGFNGVRKHQKVEDPDYLYWADVLGLLVFVELPSAYRFTHLSVERLMCEWMEIMDRDINHPCVVGWIPFNESWGVPDLAQKECHQNCVQAFYHMTKTMDASRPVISNDGWESTVTDILGIHDYDANPERMKEKYRVNTTLAEVLSNRRPGGRVLKVEGYPHEDEPIMLTEFGGIACAAIDDKGTWGYSVSKDANELRKQFEDLLRAVNEIDLFCGFCYTQFTDTFQEANGLFTADRRPKFSLTAMAHAVCGDGPHRGELITAPQPAPLPSLDLEDEAAGMQ
jgi:beta-galactosidase/beta-glucuronidase